MGNILVKAIIQTGYGAQSVLESRMIEVGDPGPTEVRVRHRAVGVNFHDIYVRSGLYRTLAVPGIPGIEAVGEIVAAGPNVGDWCVGQRVAYVDRGYGAYCEERIVSASLLIEPSASLSDGVAATSLVRGLTAAMLLEQVYRVKQGDRCLIHAVAGGMGRLLASWARHVGANVIGTAGERPVPPETAAFCDAIYCYAKEGWSERLIADQGASFDYICDSVGTPTFATSVAAAAPCARIALFGQSGGPVDQLAVVQLAAKSLTVSRPILFDYLADVGRRDAMVQSLVAKIDAGVLVFAEPVCLPLDRAGEAQAMLEDRCAPAPVVLIP